jgi:hypothetical protein
LMVTVQPDGTTAGAVYRPELLIVPTVKLPPTILLTLQVTAVLVVPFTCAVNCRVPLIGVVKLVGLMVTAAGANAGAVLMLKVIIRNSAARRKKNFCRTLILLN